MAIRDGRDTLTTYLIKSQTQMEMALTTAFKIRRGHLAVAGKALRIKLTPWLRGG